MIWLLFPVSVCVPSLLSFLLETAYLLPGQGRGILSAWWASRGPPHVEFEVRSWTSYLVGVVSKHLQRNSGSLAQGSVSPLRWEGVRTGVAPVSGHGGCSCTSCPVKEQRKGSSGGRKSSFPFLSSLGLQAMACVIQVFVPWANPPWAPPLQIHPKDEPH